jgi:hypothetical protein
MSESADREERHIITSVQREAVAGARDRAPLQGAASACPACVATADAGERAIHVILEG